MNAENGNSPSGQTNWKHLCRHQTFGTNKRDSYRTQKTPTIVHPFPKDVGDISHVYEKFVCVLSVFSNARFGLTIEMSNNSSI